jgi:hypothetical protein
MNTQPTLGTWTNISANASYARELKAFNAARDALEAKITKDNPGAVFSYKRGGAAYACPIQPVANGKGNGLSKLSSLSKAEKAALIAQLLA